MAQPNISRDAGNYSSQKRKCCAESKSAGAMFVGCTYGTEGMLKRCAGKPVVFQKVTLSHPYHLQSIGRFQ